MCNDQPKTECVMASACYKSLHKFSIKLLSINMDESLQNIE